MIASNVKTVKDLLVDETAEIIQFNDQHFVCRLYTLGIRKHLNITIVRVAPFGGGCYIRVGDSLVALRNNEAQSIIVR